MEDEEMPDLESQDQHQPSQICEDSEMENYDGTIKDLYIKSNFLENSSKCQKYNHLKQNFE